MKPFGREGITAAVRQNSRRRSLDLLEPDLAKERFNVYSVSGHAGFFAGNERFDVATIGRQKIVKLSAWRLGIAIMKFQNCPLAAGQRQVAFANELGGITSQCLLS